MCRIPKQNGISRVVHATLVSSSEKVQQDHQLLRFLVPSWSQVSQKVWGEVPHWHGWQCREVFVWAVRTDRGLRGRRIQEEAVLGVHFLHYSIV